MLGIDFCLTWIYLNGPRLKDLFMSEPILRALMQLFALVSDIGNINEMLLNRF
jgi:hypothetical protein